MTIVNLNTAVPQAGPPRGFANPVGSDEFVFNPATLTGLSGTYVIDLLQPAGTRLAESDAIVLQLRDVINMTTGDWLRPVIFPQFIPINRTGNFVDFQLVIPNRRVVNGVTQSDIVFEFRNFDLSAGPGKDSIRLEAFDGARKFAELSFNQTFLPSINGNSTVLVGEDVWVTKPSFFDSDYDELFVGVLTLLSGSQNDLANLTVDLTNFVNSKANQFTAPNSQLQALDIELEVAQLAGAFQGKLVLPKGVYSGGTLVGDVEYELLVDPTRTPALAIAAEGTTKRGWSDSIEYAVQGLGANGVPMYLAPFAGGVGVTLTLGSFNPTLPQGGTQPFSLKVDRQGITDYFQGFESVGLTGGDDVIRIGRDGSPTPLGWLSVNPLGGNDTLEWRLQTGGTNSPFIHNLKIEYEDWDGYATRAIEANFTGQTIHRGSEALGSVGLRDAVSSNQSGTNLRTATASISDSYGGVDSLRFETDASSDVNSYNGVRIGLDGTKFRDTYRLSADGLGVVKQFELDTSGGIDTVWVTDADNAPRRTFLKQVSDVTTVNNNQVNDPSLLQTSGYLIGGRFNALPTEPNTNPGLYFEVDFRTATPVGASGPVRYADLYELRSRTDNSGSLERIGVALQTAVVRDDVVAFAENPGRFAAFSLVVTNQNVITSNGSLVFSPTTVHNLFVSPPNNLFANGFTESPLNPVVDLDGWSATVIGEHGKPTYLTSIERRYQWERDGGYSPDNGVAFYNGIVDKRGSGFDRIIENIELGVVGARNYELTRSNDYVVQTVGSKAIAMHFDGLSGEDNFFYRVRNDDANQIVVFTLGTYDGWNSPKDADRDVLDIDLSRAEGAYRSTQWIYVDAVGANDQIRLLGAEDFRVTGKTRYNGGDLSPSDGVVQLFVYDEMGTPDVTDDIEVARIQISSAGWQKDWYTGSWAGDLTIPQLNNYFATDRSAFGSFSSIRTTSGNDEALVLENNVPNGGPLLFGDGNDYVIAAEGDVDFALGKGNDFISVRNHGQTLFVSGGEGSDVIGLSGGVFEANGKISSTDWEFGSIAVATAQEILRAKYPLTFTTTADPFEWSNTLLDRVMVATNRYDGTTVYFQAEELGFSSGDRRTVESFLPPIQETYNFAVDVLPTSTDPRRVTLAQNVFGRRGTEDTLTLNVNNVDEALKHVGSWLDSTTTPAFPTGILGGSHTLVIKTETAATKWFSTGRNYLAAQFNLVDIENIRLTDSTGADVTIRVAGSNGYQDVATAVARANRGDVIFVAESRELISNTGVVSVESMSKSVTVDAGLRVVFEGDANRATNKLNVATNEAFTIELNASHKSGVSLPNSSDLFKKHSNTRLLEVLGSDNVNVFGSSLDDFIIGNRGRNTIEGRGGDDLIFGGFGADILLGQHGNDIVVAGSSARINGISHTPDEGALRLSVDRGFRLVSGAGGRQVADAIDVGEHSFVTGDKVVYGFSGPTGATAAKYNVAQSGAVAADVTLTAATPLFVIVENTRGPEGESYIRFATSQADALLGKSIFITDVGTATTQYITSDLGIAAATQLAGSDYALGGTGDDIMVGVGVTGSVTTSTIRDTVTLVGGSGNDRFDLFASLGQINILGGSGADVFRATEGFSETINPTGGTARVLDFSAVQDDILGAVDPALLANGLTLVDELTRDGLVLNQLVAPPLPLVSGSGENGNYQKDAPAVETPAQQIYSFSDVTINLQDILNMHNAHAA